jgi:outer membrane protein OmpA-like peptidoglycan-associated protein
MTSKKNTLLTGLLGLLSLGLVAQTPAVMGGGPYDASVIAKSQMKQQDMFNANTYSFPAKPKNQWEVGAKVGALTISGDVPAVFPTFGFGLHVQKALGYVLAVKLEYVQGTAKGLNWNGATNYMKNPAWAGNGYLGARLSYGGPLLAGAQTTYYAPARDRIFYNYKANVKDLALFLVGNLNNIRFHKKNTGIVLYGELGIGVTSYDTKINALNGAALYNFASIANSNIYKSRKQVRKDLNALLDDSYETPAENQGARRPKWLGGTMKPSATVGFGAKIKLNKNLSINIEDRHTFTKDDLMDGQRWQEQARGDAVLTRDFDSWNFGSVGLNLNLGSKATAPLWWLNPLEYAYNGLSDVRRMPPPFVPKDDDGDGVLNEFDEEPNTPAGCPVDSKGKTLDTDGDGVPDCKDLEKITPTECQKEGVDADGRGKCPRPACCDERPTPPPVSDCASNLGEMPTLEFEDGSSKLSDDAKSALDALAEAMKANADCSVSVAGGCSDSKASKKVADGRANAVKKYLVSQGVSGDRVTVNACSGEMSENSVAVSAN